MARFKVGIIGCGRPWRSEGTTGFGQRHVHAAGYSASPDCEIVAAADILQDNLDFFCQQHNVPYRYLAIQDLADALKADREPELSARKALQAIELIFATYESSRKRGRVDLPLEIEDSPFLSMLASGEMSVEE